MVRDGAHRSQVYAGCACYGAPPHHEAERVELVPNRQDLKDSQARKRGPITTKVSDIAARHIALLRRMGPRLRGACAGTPLSDLITRKPTCTATLCRKPSIRFRRST